MTFILDISNLGRSKCICYMGSWIYVSVSQEKANAEEVNFEVINKLVLFQTLGEVAYHKVKVEKRPVAYVRWWWW